jgi:hypothetical protein
LQNDEKSTFIGVKIGDINGSAKANSSMPVSDRTTTELNLNIDNQAFTTGQTVKVAMNINDFKSIEGYQFTVNYDRKALRLNQIAGNKENFAVAEEGKIATSWNGALAQQSVVEFEFTALTNSDLKQVVTISSDVVRNEVYLNDGTFAKANLVFNGETAKNEFELFQNQPNPFNGTTLITFNSPSAGEYSLTVTDASGRTVSNAKGNAAKGLNEIKLEMPSNGIYYYTVKMADNIATKKMIVVE